MEVYWENVHIELDNLCSEYKDTDIYPEVFVLACGYVDFLEAICLRKSGVPKHEIIGRTATQEIVAKAFGVPYKAKEKVT